MKYAFSSALFAGLLTLGACAHTDQMTWSAPATLTPAQIEAELAAISAEASALRQGRSPFTITATSPAPVVLYVSDSNGVPLNVPVPDRTPSRSYGASSYSRPWGYARLEDLDKRRAELYAVLKQKMPSQR